MKIIHLSDAEFEKQVLQSGQLVIIDFWAPWCAPCRMIAPVLDELSKEYNERLKICKINVDENQKVASRYNILSIPTLLFFKSGKVVNQITGVRAASDIKKIINSLLQ